MACNQPTTVVSGEKSSLDALLKKNPADTAALYARAKYFVEKKVLDSALLDMQQLIKIDSSRAAYFVTLGDVYLFTNRTRYTRQAFEKAIKLNPDHEEAHMKLAELFLYVEMYTEALDQLNAVLKVNRRSPKAYYMKGMVYKEAGDTTLALSSFLTATEQDPEYALAFEQMGLIYAAKKDKRAPDFYQTALRLNPNSPTVLYNLGLYYQNNNQPEKAIEVFQDLLNKNPTYAYAAYNIGFIKSEIYKKPDQALEWFNKARSIQPEYAEAHYMAGYCQEALGKKQEAINAYRQTLNVNPAFAMARQALTRLGAEHDK
ncbi:MAG: tetratricopeptide repeat protein [Bacteroidia bacterium]|nr:tetratricopeptide repeat protein [Bacteroidia bacterium]